MLCFVVGVSPALMCRQILPVGSSEQKVGMDVDLDRKLRLSNDTPNSNGHRLFRATLGTLASFIVLLLVSSSASAATLNVSGGQLLGASGVIVDGSSYDVEFLDGTCVALYSGCDSVSDFTFQTSAAAILASQALVDQVFLDGGAGLFNSEPDLTTGCTFPLVCVAVTPYAPEVFVGVPGFGAGNYQAGLGDGTVAETAWPASADFSSELDYPNYVYASWTLVPVPVPGPGWATLLGLGLLGASASKRIEG